MVRFSVPQWLSLVVLSLLSGCITVPAKDPVVIAPVGPEPAVVAPADIFVGIKGHYDRLKVAAFARDGKHAATGSADMTARYWDVVGGVELMRFSGHVQPVTSVAISADSGLVATGSSDNTIRIWSTKSGRELRRLIGHTRFVSALAFSGDGLKLVSGGHDRTIKVWDLETGQLVRSWIAHQKTVSCLNIDPAMAQILSGSDDNSLALWNAYDGKVVWRAAAHVKSVISCAVSADFTKAASLGADNKIVFWDVKGGRSSRRLDQPDLGAFSSLKLNPGGDTLAYSFGSADGLSSGLRIGTVSSNKYQTFPGHTGAILAWFFSDDAVYTLGTDEKIRSWKINN